MERLLEVSLLLTESLTQEQLEQLISFRKTLCVVGVISQVTLINVNSHRYGFNSVFLAKKSRPQETWHVYSSDDNK